MTLLMTLKSVIKLKWLQISTVIPTARNKLSTKCIFTMYKITYVFRQDSKENLNQQETIFIYEQKFLKYILI